MEMEGQKVELPHQTAGNFILRMELRRKIFTFRDIIDLPPCDGTESIRDLVSRTMKDLHKFHPDSITRHQLSEIKGASIDKVLICFSEALRSTGDSWMMNQLWMDKVTSDNFSNIRTLTSEQLVEMALAILNCLINIAKVKLDMMDEDEHCKYNIPASAFGKVLMASYSESNSSCCVSPITPTSVLPPGFMDSPTSYEFANMASSSPFLQSSRVQPVGKLNPIDIKRISFHMPPTRGAPGYNFWNIKNNEVDEIMEDVEVESKPLNQIDNADEEMVFEMETSNDSEGKVDVERDCCMENSSRDIEMAEATLTTEAGEVLPTPASPPNSTVIPPMSPADVGASLPPYDPLQAPVKVQLLPSPPSLSTPMLQQSPSEILLPNTAAAAGAPKVLQPQIDPHLESETVKGVLPPSPPPPPKTSGAAIAAPPPPSMISSNGSMPLPHPPPMTKANGAAPPPPPPGAARSLRPKKAQTKLRRSSQMGNLYRILKGKVEGGSQNVKSANGRTSSATSSKGGKQGMADALAEITRRSAYFQQIREDVQKYAKPITELKIAITTFNSKDMTELIKFHKQVESVLEHLTDEAQVLAKFEDFPQKKLESLRTAAALYSKLNGILQELKNWKIVTPLGQLLDKTERYFNKIKVEMDALERTKDEESKKFQSHNIHFDFHILVQIKETLVDVSSNCMELALKERRVARTAEPNKANGKMLWRAFQFAFRVYTFAGGQDDRADKLTRELAHEIETDPQHL